MDDATVNRTQRRRELAASLLLALVFAPLIVVVLVAGYGFLVWMYQIATAVPAI